MAAFSWPERSGLAPPGQWFMTVYKLYEEKRSYRWSLLSVTLSLSLASSLLSVYCSWVIYLVYCEAFIRLIWEHACVTHSEHHAEILYTRKHFLISFIGTNTKRERPDISKQKSGISPFLLIQYYDQFNPTTNSLQSLSSTNPPHTITDIPPWPTKPNQKGPSHFQSGWIKTCWCLIISAHPCTVPSRSSSAHW